LIPRSWFRNFSLGTNAATKLRFVLPLVLPVISDKTESEEAE
jgi:hypothetical protein